MIDHNIVVVNDKEYKAVCGVEAGRCTGCHLKAMLSCNNMQCIPQNRSDAKDVIFKPHHRPKASELKW